jgi:hypothetical protein
VSGEGTMNDRHTFLLDGREVTLTTRELRDEFMEERVDLTATREALREIEETANSGAATGHIGFLARAALARLSGGEPTPDYAAFERGRNDPIYPLTTWHSEFARCPDCQNATAGLKRPYAIHHTADCSRPSSLPCGGEQA